MKSIDVIQPARIKGRGAQKKTANRYHKLNYGDVVELQDFADGLARRTIYTKVFPKTVVNKVDSPDVGMNYSLNPYQGCEHGCIYCYARPSHQYWGDGMGLDFEQKIYVKKNAPELLEHKLNSKGWMGETIVLSGNTDCYQPIEKDEEITRSLLEVFLRHKHSVGIITKNSLVLRDLDLLVQLARFNLVHVIVSITTLNETLRRNMEPRTASVLKRLEIVKKLAEHNIPVSVMMAPIIPGLNDHEIMQVAENTSKLGAHSFHYSVVRLNNGLDDLFVDWLEKHYPKKKDRVVSLIKDARGGKMNASEFGIRMTGSGSYSKYIKDMVDLARMKYFKGRKRPDLDTTLFKRNKEIQLDLFSDLA